MRNDSEEKCAALECERNEVEWQYYADYLSWLKFQKNLVQENSFPQNET